MTVAEEVRIIYQDDYFLVLDKPAGLVVDPAETVKEITLADILQKDFGIKVTRGGIVHRLDKDTSGLILAAKTLASLEHLQAQFKNRTVKKEYLALVHGLIFEPGQVNAAIIRNPKNREKFAVASQFTLSREAVTEYKPVNSFQLSAISLQKIFPDFNKIQMRKLERQKYEEFSLLRCYPKTGRTHQIRVHLKYINHPIVADEKYVGRKINRLDRRWCPRQFLHAAKIGFNHPVFGKWMELESLLPEDLKKTLLKVQEES